MKSPDIFLIGFMGSGKTHWGKIWAAKYQIGFYDLDEVIEKETGRKVNDIFEKQGEKKFRELELQYLRGFEEKRNFLLSCGGGTPCFNKNLEWMLGHGIVIYLEAKPAYILERVMEEKEKRPLLKEVNHSELLFFIQHKLKEREAFYQRAHFRLPVEDISEESLASIIQEFTENQIKYSPGKSEYKKDNTRVRTIQVRRNIKSKSSDA